MQSGTDSRLYLVVREGLARGTALTIPPGLCLVGAAEGAGLRIEAPGVAPQHLWVEVDGRGVAWAAPVEHAEVAVNGVRIDRRTMLEVGDRVAAGSVSLELATGDWEQAPGDTALRRSIPPPPSAPPSILSPGQLLSERYRVIEKLAAGGMGEVYRVRHEDLDRLFALKVMRAELSTTGDFVERFRREAVASSRIGHPNIIDITDFGRTPQGAFYFVMEHLEGVTLSQLLQREGALPVTRVMNLARQLCGALGAAHAAGIVHRDLKPDNVMLVQRPGAPDVIKVLDFGIAKVEAGNLRGGQTGVGVVVGTPQYMSPEQAAGFSVDARSDLYSLGLIFYELLAGRPAFNADTPPLMMMQQISAAPPPLPSALTGLVPVGLERAVFSMLAKRPEDRPQSMEAVLELLGDARITASTASLPPPSLPPMFGLGSPAATRTDTPRAKAAVLDKSTSEPTVHPERSRGATSHERNTGTAAVLASIRRSRRQRNGAVAAAILVSLAVLIGWLLQPEPTNSPPPAPIVIAPPPAVIDVPAPAPLAPVAPPPEAPHVVRLEVRTIPPGGMVELGDKTEGAAPLSLLVEAGTEVQLRVTKRGYLPRTVMLKLEKPRTVEVRLERAPSAGAKSPDLKDAVEDDLKELE